MLEAVTVFDPTAIDLAEYAGACVSEEIDPVYRIVLKEGKLTLPRLKHKPETLRPTVCDASTGEIGTAALRGAQTSTFPALFLMLAAFRTSVLQ